MTDHYAEAERLLEVEYRLDESATLAYAAAQVHATLATVQRPEPSHGNHYRTIPWPPSDGLVETVARVLSTRFGSETDGWPVYAADARAALDAIGGAGDE